MELILIPFGNYVIAGHNYVNSNMFKNLINLSINDSIFLLDNFHGKVEYKVYDIFKVEKNNVDCLNQNTNNMRELTLITCVNYTDYRLIIKAREF